MKKMKRISIVLIVFGLMLGASLCMPKDVKAAVKAPKFAKQDISTFVNSGDYTESYNYNLIIKNLKANAKVSNVKSSNKEVLTVEYNEYTKRIYYYPKKTGKAVISLKVKQNGKTYNLKKTIHVKKGNPFQYVKLNGKNVYKSGGKAPFHTLYSDKRNVKVNFKLKSGWKLKRMYYNYHTTGTTSGSMSKNYSIKNGGKVKIKENCNYVSVKIDVKNKKGDVYRYLICLYYNKKTNSVSAPVVSTRLLSDGTK